MADTKQEIAESLTVAQLREIAESEGVDLSGLTAKQEIADKVASSVTKDTLVSAQEGEGEQAQGGVFAEGKPATADETNASAADVASDRATYQDGVDEQASQNPFDVGNQGGEKSTAAWSAPASRGNANTEPIGEGDAPPSWGERPLVETHPLGPPNPEPQAASTAAPRNERGQVANDPESLQKAGMSPADLELPSGALGPPIIVKQNPEIPTPHQVEGSLAAVPGPPETRITVHDGDGNELPHNLGTDDRALIASRAAASQSTHPAHTTPGHWSNPNLRDMTAEEREADAAAYAERFGS